MGKEEGRGKREEGRGQGKQNACRYGALQFQPNKALRTPALVAQLPGSGEWKTRAG